MPLLPQHGIGSDSRVTPFMSVQELAGKVIAVNDRYYLEADTSSPYARLLKKDKKTHRVVHSINTSYKMYEGRGVLSGDFYIGSYRDTGNAMLVGKINILTGQIVTRMGSALFNQTIGIHHKGYNYFLLNTTTILKFDSKGNEVAVFTVTGAQCLLGATDNKLLYSVSNGGFRVIDINIGGQIGSFSSTVLTNHILYNATFLKNGNIIACAYYTNTIFSTVLLETVDGLAFTLKTNLTLTCSPLLIDSRKEWFYVKRSGSPVTRIVDNELNTVKDDPTKLTILTPYELASRKDPYVFANSVQQFGSQPSVSTGALITKGALV